MGISATRVRHPGSILGAISHSLEYHDLLKVPRSGREDSICWLRFYRGDPCVAIVTNVPGNPAYSVTNMVSKVADHIARRFSVDIAELVLFEIWPRIESHEPKNQRVTFTSDGKEKPPGWRKSRDRPALDTSPFTGSPEWWSAERTDIETLVGESLPDLPSHETLYQRVLALGGGTSDQAVRHLFAAVDVRELPSPHNPSSCHWITRFRSIEEKYGPTERDRLQAGREFLDGLTLDDRRKCPFHAADWAAVADASVHIIEELGRRDTGDYLSAVGSSGLAEPELMWLESLFRDPVFIGGGSYTNGQHRGCALLFSGAERAAVVVGYEFLDEFSTDWQYEGEW